MSAVTSSRPRLRTRRCPSVPPTVVGAASSLPWQPDRTLTRRSARIAREVYAVWSVRVGSVTRLLPADQVSNLLRDMQLYPSQAQVDEILQCAQDCSDRSPPTHLTFGEFCLFATELKRCRHRGLPRTSHLASKSEARDGKDKRKTCRKMSKTELGCNVVGVWVCPESGEVFLGGSCNPTTWRHDVAIPLLHSMGISYFNPQVEEWSEELVEQEHLAKEKAGVLFYVIDSQTRNVVSMIEAAAFAGARRKLVLVIKPYKPSHKIAGETISQQEFMELSGSLVVLKTLVERQGIPVFYNIPEAINCTAKMLRADINEQDIVMTDLNHPVTNGYTPVTDKLFKLKEAFNNRDKNGSGSISLADVCMAYRQITKRKLSVSELKGLVSNPSDNMDPPVQVNFEEFCTIIGDLKSGDNHNNNNNNDATSAKWVLCKRPAVPVNCCCVRDVLLAGDSSDLAWTYTLAVPYLQRRGLHYQVLEEWSDLSAVDNSYVLLFVVTSQSRSLPVMAMASHYIGLGCNVVLCIQHITEGLTVNGEKLSKQAVNDYNRGRIYLKDLARRDNIPTFSSIQEAVDCVVALCQSR